jgi:anti-anti-sigma factor
MPDHRSAQSSRQPSTSPDPSNVPSVQFRREERNGEATLIVAGDIDIASIEAFRQELTKLIEAAHSPAVIDLRELQFIDSSGLSALLSARLTAQVAGVDLMLEAPTPLVQRMLDISGASNELTIRR